MQAHVESAFVGTTGTADTPRAVLPAASGTSAPDTRIGRIPAIEGLRAWLAWTVVLYHVLGVTNVFAYYNFTNLAHEAGQGAVHIFIMISGFVIAHMLIERKEDYLSYITRRAFRLFPAYWVALALASVCMYLKADIATFVTWGSDPSYLENVANNANTLAAVEAHPWAHILLHVVLLQGLPPPGVLPYSANTLLGPAWSLTLEWQFYLLAPALIWMVQRRDWAVVMILAATIAYYLQSRGRMPAAISDTSLPAWLYLFAIGICSRRALPQLKALTYAACAAALAVASLVVLSMHFPTIALWLAFVVMLSRGEAKGLFDRIADRLFRFSFESKTATTLGARSYSVYVLHTPLMAAVSYVIFQLYPFDRIQGFIALTLVVTPVILLASDLLYRFVERPLIDLGARLLRQRKAASAPTPGQSLSIESAQPASPPA